MVTTGQVSCRATSGDADATVAKAVAAMVENFMLDGWVGVVSWMIEGLSLLLRTVDESDNVPCMKRQIAFIYP